MLELLKRKEERAIIFLDKNGEVEVVRENLDLIKENVKDYVIIYNPTGEQLEEISKFFLKKLDRKKAKSDEIFITPREMLIKFIPELTSLKEFKNLSDVEKDEILNDPSELLLEINNELGRILSKQYTKTLETVLEINTGLAEVKKLLDKLEDVNLSDVEKDEIVNKINNIKIG